MKDLVRAHAIKNVWAATNQDFQHNIKLVRITPNGGVLANYKLLWDTLLTPRVEMNKWYFHFYQIGQVPPEVLDVFKKENRWICLKQLNDENSILVDVYSATGQIIPRDHVFISFLYNKNLVVAVRVNSKIDYGLQTKIRLNQSREEIPYTLDNQTLIIRFYSNAWFNDIEYRENKEQKYAVNEPIRFMYKTVKNRADWDELHNAYRAVLRENPLNKDRIVWYENGFHINTPVGQPADSEGKHYGWMFDDSFFHVETFPIRHLSAFISERDRGRRKYLIYPNINDGLIHYWDDVDFYVINDRTGKGVYYNRSAKWALRQITHNIWALDADIVEDYLKFHSFLGTIDECSIKIMVRQGGRKNGVMNQKTRLNELYKLGREAVMEALINVPSLVPEWRAVNLEKSDFMNLISANPNELSKELVASAYGYNGLVTSFAQPFAKVEENSELIPISPLLRTQDIATKKGVRTYFLYNKAGLMVEYTGNDSLIAEPKIKHVSNRTDLGYIESFNMRMNKRSLYVKGNVNYESWDLEQYGFRCFVSSEGMTGPIGTWDDVTESNLYTYTPGKGDKKPSIKWNWNLLTQANLVPLIYVMKDMYVYETQLSRMNGDYDGVIEFQPKYILEWNNKEHVKPVDIPVGNVEVFVNGLSLIEGVDFEFHNPTIVINTHGLHTADVLNVVVRYYGFADPSTDARWKPREIGYVKGGKLSIDGQYDLHEDLAGKIVLGGLVKQIGDINTGEKDGKASAPHDGTPFAFVDYHIPTENIISKPFSYPLYKEVIDVDAKVSNYLTHRIPQIEPVFPHVHIQRYRLVSPVCSAIINAMLKGVEFDELVINNYNTQEIDNYMKPFKWLLKFDPAHLNYDENYTYIEPHGYTHNVSLSQKQYTFLEWVIRLYLNDRVDLTHNVVIG